MLWRYDPLALQSHLTNSQVDTFLGKVIRGFPQDVQVVLIVSTCAKSSESSYWILTTQILSCLPSAGVRTSILADIVAQPLTDLETSLHVSCTAGWTLIKDSSKEETVKFSHDRYRVRLTTLDASLTYQSTSFGLISRDEQAAILLRVSQHLSRPTLRDEYLLVAADLALNAKNRGSVGNVADFMSLMLAAAEKSNMHASFLAAKRFLDGYDSKYQTSIRTSICGDESLTFIRSGCGRRGPRAYTISRPTQLLSLPSASISSVWSPEDCVGRT